MTVNARNFEGMVGPTLNTHIGRLMSILTVILSQNPNIERSRIICLEECLSNISKQKSSNSNS